VAIRRPVERAIVSRLILLCAVAGGLGRLVALVADGGGGGGLLVAALGIELVVLPGFRFATAGYSRPTSPAHRSVDPLHQVRRDH